MKQAILDRVRVFNKHVTNKLLIHLCGREFGHFAILTHTGRNSGRLYRIPIIAEPVENGFVFALTYGLKVDWYANVKAKGGCSIYWKKRDWDLVNPRLIENEVGVQAFPRVMRSVLKSAGIEYFLQLDLRQ